MGAESLADRIQRLRAARGLSERELALRMGMTLHQYDSVMRANVSPTSALLVELADALDVLITDLAEITIETAPSLDDMRALRKELRWRRATLTGGTNQVGRLDRQLARLNAALGMDSEPSADALQASATLMRAIERNESVRAIASRYAQLVLQRCEGKKGVAARVLGVQHQTLGKYLRYAVDDDRTTMQTIGDGRIIRSSEGDVESARVA